MKKQLFRTSMVTLTALVMILSVSISAFAAGDNAGKGQANQVQVSALTEEETAWLVYMREEEKLARDVYLELNDIWNEPVFANIAVSEQRHMDAVERLLGRYDIDDPVADESIRGTFTNQDLQALYESLIAKGSTSLVAAFEVGVTIEETDIADIQEALLATSDTHKDIETVYMNLLEGSYSHLAAFDSHL